MAILDTVSLSELKSSDSDFLNRVKYPIVLTVITKMREGIYGVPSMRGHGLNRAWSLSQGWVDRGWAAWVKNERPVSLVDNVCRNPDCTQTTPSKHYYGFGSFGRCISHHLPSFSWYQIMDTYRSDGGEKDHVVGEVAKAANNDGEVNNNNINNVGVDVPTLAPSSTSAQNVIVLD